MARHPKSDTQSQKPDTKYQKGKQGQHPNSRANLRSWKKGQPAAYVPPSDDKRRDLGAEMANALANDFARYGKSAISKLRKENPGRYLQICQAMLPKQQEHVIVNEFSEMSDAQIKAKLGQLLRDITPGRLIEADIIPEEGESPHANGKNGS